MILNSHHRRRNTSGLIPLDGDISYPDISHQNAQTPHGEVTIIKNPLALLREILWCLQLAALRGKCLGRGCTGEVSFAMNRRESLKQSVLSRYSGTS